MEVKRLTVSQLARQLSECNQDAEVRVIIGMVPQSIPIGTIAIKEDIEGNEIVALVVDHETFVEVLDYGIGLIERKDE